jgi:hypothetical protein
VLAGVSLIYCLLVILGFNAGAADEIDLWGFQFCLLAFGMIEAVLFSWVLGVDQGWEEMNRGADIRIHRVFKFIIRYVTPTFLIVLLVLWFVIGGGFKSIFLTQLKVQQITFLGLEMSNRAFILFMRLMIIIFLGVINLAIYLAWKYRNLNQKLEQKVS